MLAKHQETCRSNKILPLVCVGLFCLTAGLVFGQNRSERATSVLLEKRETINTIPKEYGRLAGVERSSNGTVLYFEATDGTIRFVSVDYGVDHGSLKFKTVTVPRT